MNVAQQEWIGELPSGWDTVSLRDVLIERKELNKLRQETNILSVTNDRGVINYRDKGNVGNKASDDIERYKRVYRGDIVANSMNVIIGSVGISPEDGVLSPVYIVMKPADDVDTRFYDYIFKAKGFQAQLKRIGYGILDHRMRIPWDNLKIQQLPKPDYETQQKIADFLDTETAQIDNLIAKQERLLELLEEKRRATITHAVTRGLNPGVELKETNIPWLAQIPAHWSVAKIRYLANLKTGSTPKDNEGINQEGDGSGWITPGDFVTDLYINDWTKYVTTSAQDKFKIRLFNSPSILFIGIGATAGKIGYVREPVYSNQQITAIMPNSKAVPEYMLYYLHTISGTMRSTASYATLPIINNQFLSTVMHPVPGLTEQREIAHYLDEQDKKVNKLKQKIQTQITLLRERRTSLISHAVTGKIKV